MSPEEPMIYSAHAVGRTALATERVERRLAAILATGVADHSRLMGAGEGEALASLKAYRRRCQLDPGTAPRVL